MALLIVKPADGRRVRMPDRGFLVMPPEGQGVPDAPYYRGLIRDGDLVLVEPKPSDLKPVKSKA